MLWTSAFFEILEFVEMSFSWYDHPPAHSIVHLPRGWMHCNIGKEHNPQIDCPLNSNLCHAAPTHGYFKELILASPKHVGPELPSPNTAGWWKNGFGTPKLPVHFNNVSAIKMISLCHLHETQIHVYLKLVHNLFIDLRCFCE